MAAARGRTAAAPGTSPGPASETAGRTLRDVALRSGAYLAGREAIGLGIRLAGLVLVMRRIGPGDFGIYSGAAAYVLFATALAQMGAEVFLVRQPGPLPRRRYDEVFTVLLGSSLVVVAVGMGLSFAVAPWLRPHGVVVPMRILLLSVPVNVLWAPMQACIERSFAYRRMGLLELGGDVALYATALPLAMVGAGPWALIAGFFAWQTWLLVGSMALSGLWPRIAWSRRTASELFVHGRTYAITTWVGGARSAILTMIVGTYAGTVGVGLVNFAQRLVGTLNFTDRGVHRIGLVAISQAGKDRPGRLSSALEEGTLLLMVAAAVPFAAFGVVAHWAVPAVFGRAWLPALPVYVLLAVWATLRVPVSVQRTLLYAYGQNLAPAVTATIEVAIVTAGSLVLIRQLGIAGFGVASVLAVSSTAYTHRAAHRLAAIRYRRLVLPLAALLPPMFIAVTPMPWSLLLVVPPLALLAVPSVRSEIGHLASVARATVARRASGPPADAPTAAPRTDAAPTAAPRTDAAGARNVPAAPARMVVVVAAFEAGGPEMAANGSRLNGSRLNGYAPPSLYPPFRAWRQEAGTVVDPTDPRIADRRVSLGSLPGETGGSVVPRQNLAGLRAAGALPLPGGRAPGRDLVAALLSDRDPVTGLPSAAVLLGKVGRVLGATRGAGWSLAVVAIRLARAGGTGPVPSEDVLAAVAAELQSELRFDDLVARVGPSTFVVATPCIGDDGGCEVAAHLEAAARRASASRSIAPQAPWAVRSVREVVPLPCDRDADALVRQVVEALDG